MRPFVLTMTRQRAIVATNFLCESSHMSAGPLPEDAFITQFLGAMALDHALRGGVIDALARGERVPPGTLAVLLRSAGVLDGDSLSPDFAHMLSTRREILEQKLTFLRMVAADITLGLDDLLGNLPAFMAQSRTFGFFDYERALTTSPSAIAATRKWVDYVTALSRAEAPLLAPALPLNGATRLLEIGGNSGVMAKAVLDLSPQLQCVIMDLPSVCVIGSENPHPRLTFAPGDARKDPWPLVAGAAPDVILFKSVLHDWPEEDAHLMLARAAKHVAPGGQVIVCERGPIADGPMPFSMAANLVFAPFYRDPGFYLDAFASLGIGDAATSDIALEMVFHIISGTAP